MVAAINYLDIEVNTPVNTHTRTHTQNELDSRGRLGVHSAYNVTQRRYNSRLWLESEPNQSSSLALGTLGAAIGESSSMCSLALYSRWSFV